MEKIKYIDDKIENGILIDWKKVRKRCKSLGIPPEVVVPFDYPFERCPFHIIFNERSTGKTTNWLLLGMVLNDMYGIVIQYIRQIVDHILPKKARALFKTVLEYDYISKITDGKYNAVKYSSRGFYYINTETEDVAPEEFIHLLSIDEAMTYKSVYNAPRGDLIIFDEFISKYNRPDEFVDFMDLIKTIIRDRYSPIIALLANTIDPYNIYFKEFEVFDDVNEMIAGESRIVKTDGGTNIFLHYPKDGKDKIKKERHNAKYFGFKNSKLNAITGAGWSIPNYQHVPKKCKKSMLCNNYYIDFNGKFIQLEISKMENIGYGIIVHESNMIYDDLHNDSIVYTTGDINDYRFRYCFGHTTADMFIWKLYKQNKFYYAHNTLGQQVESYVKSAKMSLK